MEEELGIELIRDDDEAEEKGMLSHLPSSWPPSPLSPPLIASYCVLLRAALSEEEPQPEPRRAAAAVPKPVAEPEKQLSKKVRAGNVCARV